MKSINRRFLLSSAALAGAALALGACSSEQVATFESDWGAVEDALQSAVAQAAKYIPTVESIVATAASLFGPQYAALVQIGTAAFNQVVTALTNVVGALTPPALATMRRALATSSPNVPVSIGRTVQGVVVLGWKVQ
jgi:hypothetical protein